MTAARRTAKTAWTAFPVLIALAVLAPACADPLVVNPDTGLAISGFDPVAYFADRKASVGRSDLELTADGAVWRFRNASNRTVFAAHPDVYRPRFGGYDPVAVAAGRSVAGHPLFWAITSERLYLFYSAENRETFLADPGRVIEAANRDWPTVERTIAR
jgi:hypothetical protein